MGPGLTPACRPKPKKTPNRTRRKRKCVSWMQAALGRQGFDNQAEIKPQRPMKKLFWNSFVRLPQFVVGSAEHDWAIGQLYELATRL